MTAHVAQTLIECLDTLVVGAGISELSVFHRLLNVKAFEAGNDLGGTWFSNRHPGVRSDSVRPFASRAWKNCGKDGRGKKKSFRRRNSGLYPSCWREARSSTRTALNRVTTAK